MDEKCLVEVVGNGENDRVEFKKSTSQSDKSLKAICGFLNHKGGAVYFGIYGESIVGQSVSESTLKSISQKIRQRIKPEIHPEIKVIDFEGKKIIEVRVAEGINKPYHLNGIAYKRIGSETTVMSPEELEIIILNKNKIQWDSEVCEGATIDDISQDSIEEYKKRYHSINKKMIYASNNELLRTLHCLDKNLRPTNAGILLFGKEPQSFLLKSHITIVRYPDVKVTDTHIDSKYFYGTLFEQVDSADKYLRDHIEVVSKIPKDGLKREDTPIYPYFSIRELIINAIAHRDYSFYGSRILISVFKDRIEFFSPGSFSGGVTVNNIVDAQFSRNPIIARVFHDIAYIEEYGNGIDRLLEEVKNHPFKSKMPKFIDIDGAVIVTLYKPKIKSFKIYDLDITERQKDVLQYIKNKNRINNKAYTTRYHVSSATAKRELQDMVNKNILKQVGQGRTTYYILSDPIMTRL